MLAQMPASVRGDPRRRRQRGRHVRAPGGLAPARAPTCACSASPATSARRRRSRPASRWRAAASSSPPTATCRTTRPTSRACWRWPRPHDIVCGWRRRRQDAFLTRHLPSVVANWLIGAGQRRPALHDNGCSLKVFRAEVVKPLKLEPGMHRYLPAIASQLGGRVAEVVVNHRPRRFGRSKYGLSRTFRVVGDLLRLRPLMRRAVDRPPSAPPLYEVAEALPRASGLEPEAWSRNPPAATLSCRCPTARRSRPASPRRPPRRSSTST